MSWDRCLFFVKINRSLFCSSLKRQAPQHQVWCSHHIVLGPYHDHMANLNNLFKIYQQYFTSQLGTNCRAQQQKSESLDGRRILYNSLSFLVCTVCVCVCVCVAAHMLLQVFLFFLGHVLVCVQVGEVGEKNNTERNKPSAHFHRFWILDLILTPISRHNLVSRVYYKIATELLLLDKTVKYVWKLQKKSNQYYSQWIFCQSSNRWFGQQTS